MKSLVVFAMIIVSGLIIIPPSSYALTPPHQIPMDADYNEQVAWQQIHLWQLGKNLSIGDSYTYKICDPKTIQTSAQNYHYFTQGNNDHNSSVCYMIKLDFVNLLTSNENQVNERDAWVVQAAIHEKNNLRYSVFHIDTLTFEVKSTDTVHPDTIKYAKSLQNTLFSLFKYTAPEPQLLQIDEDWGEVTEALRQKEENPHMTVLDNNQEFSVTQNHICMIDKQNIPITRDIKDAFQVGYEIDIFDPFVLSDDKKIDEDTNNVTTFFLISHVLPFPLYAESYNSVYVTQPQKQFEFQLISFMTNNKNIDFEKSVPDESSKEDDVDLPIIEIGTIELTFLPNDDVISEEDKIENVPVDDNEVIDDIPEYDKEIIPGDGQEVIPEDNDDVEITPNDVTVVNNDKVDYSKIAGLVILLSVMITGFVIFKKFRESRFKNILKQKPQQHQARNVIISFNDRLHIDIKSK